MKHLIIRWRRLLIVGLHVGLVVLSNYLAFWLRFDGDIPPRYWTMFQQALPWLVLIRGLTFVPFRLYQGLWRYTGLWDLLNILAGVGLSTVIFVGFVTAALGLAYPRSIYIIDALLLVVLMGGTRMGRRTYREFGLSRQARRVLIFGAGDAGEMIVRDMKNNPFYDSEPVGFVDDDPAKRGTRIHGVPVLGTRRDVARVVASIRADEVVVAVPRAEPAVMREIVRSLEAVNIPIKTLPNLRDVLDGRVSVSQIRNLSVEDLLSRAPVGLDSKPLRDLVAGRPVLVTGAGGSIGSELCRQLIALGPDALLLCERYENGLYAIDKELRGRAGDSRVLALVADVTDARRVEEIMAQHRPQLVFHAAAHKHVPLMQENPAEAVKNNVTGTRIVAEAADRFGVAEFVFISTDKAVNPTSVMGASKRVAEFVVQSVGSASRTRFVTVRFGNVLNSNGSVVPLFLEQIARGGPVTVTDPDVRRYFMLIPEAVQLVLHAAALGEPGALYALDMGEQIRVLDMARNLIRLSGYVPEQDIPITFTGLRPGEKLFEELVGGDEIVEPSPVDKIMRVRRAPLDGRNAALLQEIARLERTASSGATAAVLGLLGHFAPALASQAPIESQVAAAESP